MKKFIIGTIILYALLNSGVFAADTTLVDPVPTLYSDLQAQTNINSDNIQDSTINDLIKKYEIVLRNNNLESDYEYNNQHYYTSKMKVEDVIVPDEIINNAKKIYFLVEEGKNNIFYAKDSLSISNSSIEEVKKEYNYRILDYKKDQKEYVFNNSDLVKDFGTDENRNVQITLMADFSDTQKVAISNTVYINIASKKDILLQISNEENKDDSYYGYYNINDLEDYLEKISASMIRSEYKSLLQKAEKKIKTSIIKNEDNINTILDSIKVENDFKQYINTYFIYSETSNLLSSLATAIKNQLQNIRAYEAIDAIFK